MIRPKGVLPNRTSDTLKERKLMQERKAYIEWPWLSLRFLTSNNHYGLDSLEKVVSVLEMYNLIRGGEPTKEALKIGLAKYSNDSYYWNREVFYKFLYENKHTRV